MFIVVHAGYEGVSRTIDSHYPAVRSRVPSSETNWRRTRRWWEDRCMIPSFWRMVVGSFLLTTLGLGQCHAVELRVSRDVLQRTLKQQLFSGPNGRYYLKGNAQSPCYVYAEDAQLSFAQDCLGITLATSPQVSLAPVGEGEVIGFRDARLDKIVDQKELNFFLTPFLSRQLPSSMKVNAADLLRKALAGSTASSGYKVTLDKFMVHSMHVQGDDLVVDADGDIVVK